MLENAKPCFCAITGLSYQHAKRHQIHCPYCYFYYQKVNYGVHFNFQQSLKMVLDALFCSGVRGI